MVLGLLVILTGCPETAKEAKNIEPKGMVNFTFFNTVSYVYCYADNTNEVFEERCNAVWDILKEYHQLFDIYYEYSGVVNLKTLNENAGGEAMVVDSKLIDFLLYAKELYTLTNGEMNIMMGSVLKLWHDCREKAGDDPSNAHIPTEYQLTKASLSTSISSLEIDVENSTVRISDPDASIDVGALGKGYATEKAAQYLQDNGADSYVLNIGGNIRIVGSKPDGSGWKTGIKNPEDTSTFASYIMLANTSCVTSGNYERYFTVDGKRYHHIIDKDTLMPSSYFSSVTIITSDSGLADALSTALFAMSYEEGLTLVENIGEVDVLWITTDGTQYMTNGFSKLLTSPSSNS
jgi:thiamine biosynthesis lipoprotein